MVEGGVVVVESACFFSMKKGVRRFQILWFFLIHNELFCFYSVFFGDLEGAGTLTLGYSVKDVVLAVQYKVYLVKRVISLVDTVQYS